MKRGKTTRLYGNHGELIERLRGRHWERSPTGSPRWVFLPNLRVETGFGPNMDHKPQTLDAWAMDTWPSGGYQMIAYEVKVSRSDYFRELEHPNKRKAALALSTHFYFVTPPALVSAQEVPAECGLLYVFDRQIRQVKPAPRRPLPTPTWDFIVSVVRNLYKEAANPTPSDNEEGAL